MQTLTTGNDPEPCYWSQMGPHHPPHRYPSSPPPKECFLPVLGRISTLLLPALAPSWPVLPVFTVPFFLRKFPTKTHQLTNNPSCFLPQTGNPLRADSFPPGKNAFKRDPAPLVICSCPIIILTNFSRRAHRAATTGPRLPTFYPMPFWALLDRKF